MTLREPQTRVPSDFVQIPDLDDRGAVDLSSVIGGVEGRIMDGAGDLRVGTSALRRYRQVGLFLIPLDILCLVIALLVAHALR